MNPNVLLICTDHFPGMVAGPAGHPVVMTPTLNQLSRGGVWFRNAYSACPSCIPARRALITGQTARTHGDRYFDETMRMPAPSHTPTLAKCFRDAGYQAYAVGKLHVYPQRDRIGFDDVILNEEGRHHLGMRADDWEQDLADAGYAGQEYATGVSNNDYNVTPWHLPDHLHQTNWTARQMCRTIHRRDPHRPGFWYLSFAAPHPPMTPLATYLDIYRNVPMDEPVIGQWAQDPEAQPWVLRSYEDGGHAMRDAPAHEIDLARRAFYASLTHIDHQIRVVIGTLREEGLLDNTIIIFTSDHGDMLGDHRRWGKTMMFDMCAKVPLLVVPTAGDRWITPGSTDERLVELRDIMPTLLDLADLPSPLSVEGQSLIGTDARTTLYGEHWEGPRSVRMVRDEQYKLIYYPVGNRTQLFDLHADPRECHDLSNDAGFADVHKRLTETLIAELYGQDLEWLQDGQLVGWPDKPTEIDENRGLCAQRGIRFM